MLFLRLFQHLLPRAQAWRLFLGSTLRKFFEGLTGLPAAAREYADAAYGDLFPETTREIEGWEAQFGLAPASSMEVRRQNVDAAWKSMGGQSPRYLQDAMQAAGFNVFIHEWWEPGSMPRVVRDPRDYTTNPLFGTVQCGEADALCGEPDALCNRFWANETGYLVNKSLRGDAPPPVPDDPTKWPYFIYWCGETFGDPAVVPTARRAEFESKLLTLCPSHQWLVTIIDYQDDVDTVVVGTDSVIAGTDRVIV